MIEEFIYWKENLVICLNNINWINVIKEQNMCFMSKQAKQSLPCLGTIPLFPSVSYIKRGTYMRSIPRSDEEREALQCNTINPLNRIFSLIPCQKWYDRDCVLTVIICYNYIKFRINKGLWHRVVRDINNS